MLVQLMKGKIHRATVTECDLHYEGSVSVDAGLIRAAGFLLHERVDIYNINNGERFSTYVIEAPEGSGSIGLNGAAARLAMQGDKIILCSYALFSPEEALRHTPLVVMVDEQNRVKDVKKA